MGDKAMSKRHHAREMAIQMLFQLDIGGSTVSARQVFARFNLEEYAKTDDSLDAAAPNRVLPKGPSHETRAASFEYARELVEGTLQRKAEIDDLLRSQADHWRLERMPVVDRNILRVAVYEFLSQIDVPKLVVIDEAIELAKKFGSEESGRFVNGLLDGLLKEKSFPGTVT